MNAWYDNDLISRRMLLGPRARCVLGLWLMVCCISGSAKLVGQEPTKEVTDNADVPTSETTDAKLPTLALVGAVVHTLGDQGVISQGVVLVSGESIVGVGNSELPIPDGVQIIDVSGLVLTPGLIDASSRLWLTTASANSSASDATLDVIDGIDGYSEDWHEVARHGVTTVYVQPSNAGTLGGYGAVLSVVPGDVGPTIIKSDAALQSSLGVGAANNRARVQQFDRTKKLLGEAAEYQKKWDEYKAFVKKKDQAEKKATETQGKSSQSKSSAGSKSIQVGNEKEDADKTEQSKPSSGPVSGSQSGKDAKVADANGESNSEAKKEDSEEKAPEKPKLDVAKARLAKVVHGQVPLRLEINSADDAFYALKLIQEFPNLQVIFSGLHDLRSATQNIQQLGAPIVLGPWLSSESNYRSNPDSKRVWSAAFSDYPGAVVIATAGSSERSSRLLRAHVGEAVAAGMDAEDALQAVTLNAARVLGVEDQIGSIAMGKRADLVCFNGSPTNISSPVQLVIAAGKVIFDAGEREGVDSDSPARASSVSKLASLTSATYAIRTQHYLLSDGTNAPRTLIVDAEHGKLIAIEPVDFQVDRGIRVVDIGEAWLTPGLFSSYATLGLSRLVEPQLSDATYVVAADAITANFAGESKRVREGLLRALVSPGQANTIAGRASVIRLGAKEPVVLRDAALKFNLTDAARSIERFPSSLAGQLQLIKESLAGNLLDTRLYLPPAVQVRLAKQRSDKLAAVTEGRTSTLLAATTDSDIRAALDLVEGQKLKSFLVGARQLKPFVERLKKSDVTVVARPVRMTDYNWYPEDLAEVSQAGVNVCFAGENAEELRLTAALAVEAGMSPTAALSGLCFGPRDWMDVDEDAADFVIWSGTPLDLRALPLCVVVDGVVVSGASEEGVRNEE